MKTRICSLLLAVLLSQPILLPLLEAKAQADTRVVVTFAVGGAVCGGVFFFFRFTSRGSLFQQQENESGALFNRGLDGWAIGFPSVNFTKDEGLKMSLPEHSSETVQMELLRFRF